MKKMPTSSFLQAYASPLNYLEPPLNYLGLALELLGASFELLGAAQQTNGWTIEVEDVGRTITDRRGMMTTRGGERVDAGLQRQGSVRWGR